MCKGSLARLLANSCAKLPLPSSLPSWACPALLPSGLGRCCNFTEEFCCPKNWLHLPKPLSPTHTHTPGHQANLSSARASFQNHAAAVIATSRVNDTAGVYRQRRTPSNLCETLQQQSAPLAGETLPCCTAARFTGTHGGSSNRSLI